MAGRKRISQTQRVRNTLKVSLAAATVAIAGLSLMLLVVFQLSNSQEGKARSRMKSGSIRVLSDTSSVLRGAINQPLIGIELECTGTGEALRLQHIRFSLAQPGSTSNPQLENLRLWYCGTRNEFMTRNQVGSTRNADADLIFTTDLELQPGMNYFWLSADILPEAGSTQSTGKYIGMTCDEVRMGALSIRPLHSEIAAKHEILSNIPYFSMGSYPLNKTVSWNSKRDGSGSSPRALNDPQNSFFIQAGHTMISTNGGNLNTLVVENGGALKITAPLRLHQMNIASGAKLINESELSVNRFLMDAHSLYVHAAMSPFPSESASLHPASVQHITQVSANTFLHAPVWGNVIIDHADGWPVDVSEAFRRVQGTLELRRTKGMYCSKSSVWNIGGNLEITGALFAGMNETGSLQVNVDGDLIMTGGHFQDSGHPNGTTVLRVDGNVFLSSGTFRFDQNAASRMIMSGKKKSRWLQKEEASVVLGNVYLQAGKELVLSGNRMGEFAPNSTFEVSAGSKLICGNTIVSGQGRFLLNALGTLGVGHIEGINSSSASGNIQTRYRVFHSGANYLYHSSAHPQKTGDFVTSPESATIRMLIVEKERSGQAVVLSHDLKVSEGVQIRKGDIREEGSRLILPGWSSK